MPNSSGETNAVSIKLPEFWKQMPSAWFIQAESQFELRNITVERTKYLYVVQALPQDVIMSIHDILTSESNTPYSDLKKALIERNSMSESKRVEQLLSGEEIGDRKPSDFYRRLKTLAGDSTMVTSKLILELWLRRLPTLVQTLIKSSDKTEPNDLISLADKIYETYQEQSNHNSFNTPSTSNQAIFELTLQNQQIQQQNLQLKSEISEIKHMLSKFNLNNNDQRGRSSSRRRFQNSRSKSRSNNHDMCWFHYKFGNAARNCKPPCTFKNNNLN